MRAACLLLFLWWCSVSSAAVSPLCLTHAALSVAEARRGATWALHMLDASTKVPDGLLYGNTQQLGQFDQCLAVDVHPETLPAFQGRYCRAWVNLPVDESLNSSSTVLSFKTMYAVCLPSSCSPEDVAPLLQDYAAPFFGLDVNVTEVDPNFCYVKTSEPLSAAQITGITVLALLMLIVLICTCLEMWRGPESPQFLRAVSARTTVRQLFSTRREPGALSCLHGLRVGSILWVILGHRFSQNQIGSVSNTWEFYDMLLSMSAMTVVNAMLSVDTFFFLGGLLMCLSFMREMERGASFDVLKFYLYRYLRLSVPMLVVIIFYATVFPILGSGPMWNQFVTSEAEACKLYWWANMAYINNYYYYIRGGARMCLGQTWYLAVDMQLAWLSPLVLLPLKFSPRAGLQLTSLLILISCAIPFTLTYVYKYQMALDMFGRDEIIDFGIHIYDSTPTRSVNYLCGILLGYFLFKTRKQGVKIPQIAVALGWTLSTLVCLTIVYSITVMYQPGFVYDDLAAAFYAGLNRLAWCAGLSWIIVACVNGYGGVVDKLLSMWPLMTLSRLSYGAYLVHFVIILYDRGTSRTAKYFNHFPSLHAFLGDLVPVFSLALLLYVVVEGPLLGALRIVFRERGRKSAENKQDLTENKEKLDS